MNIKSNSMKMPKEFLDTLIKYIDAMVDESSLGSAEELKEKLYIEAGINEPDFYVNGINYKKEK